MDSIEWMKWQRITEYIRDNDIDIPIFTRMCGTKEEEGKKIMAQSSLETYYDLTETIQKCVDSSKGGV